MTTSSTCGEGESTDERRQGRTAIATKHGIKAYALAIQEADTLLAESGRWHERMIPTRNGESFIIVATLYGYSRASWDPALEKRNDTLLGAAVCRACQFLTTPYYLCADLHQAPELSHPVTTAVKTGLLIDLAADWLNTENGVPPTYRRSGVYQGMSGAGITRIDTMLTNCIGAAVVTKVSYHWEGSSVYDHVPISITLSHARMQQQVWRAGRPIGIEKGKHLYRAQPSASAEKRAQLKEAATETYQAFWKPFEAECAKAEACNDYEEVHRLWCLTAELWLYLSQIDDHDPWAEGELDGFYKR